jgi:hypothetical protein
VEPPSGCWPKTRRPSANETHKYLNVAYFSLTKQAVHRPVTDHVIIACLTKQVCWQ